MHTNETTPLVGIITVNWNDYPNSARLLLALRELSYPNIKAIVVDNGSKDGSADRLQTEFPEILCHKMQYNAGFGAANNAGLKLLQSEKVQYVWLLNNDTIPVHDSLEKLLSCMQSSPTIGAVGGIIQEDQSDRPIQAYGGANIHEWRGIAKSAKNEADTLDFLTGACILFRMQVLDEVGFFDKRFFLYWEDADLCIRLMKAGWKLAVAPAYIIHTGSVSTGKNQKLRSYHIMRSFHILMHKHSKRPRLKSISAMLYQTTGKLLHGNVQAALGCIQGWYSARKSLPF